MNDVSAFAALVLVDDAGRPVRPRELWRERPVVFVFLRHWGWIFCRRRVADVAARVPEFRAAGADVALVGQGTPAMAADARRETGWEGTMLVDAEGAAYREAGMGKTSILGLLRPRLLWAILAARRRGFRQTKVLGDAWRLGGMVVVAPGGRVLFARADRRVEDDLPADEALDALAAGAG